MNLSKFAIGAVARGLVRSSLLSCLFSVGALGLFWTTPVRADTVTIQPSTADTYLRQDNANGTAGGQNEMRVRSRDSNRNRRSLVRFLLDAIPSGSQITSATLELYMTQAPPGGNRTYDVHRVTRSWVEAQASWNNAATGTPWTNPGGDGDYVATPTDSRDTQTQSGVWLSWNVTADVQAWWNGTATNYGFLVKDSVESDTPSATDYEARFATRENWPAANQPKLIVTYTPPNLQVISMTVNGSVASGGTVTVSMRVTNNGPTTVFGVIPSLSYAPPPPPPNATATLVTPPSPPWPDLVSGAFVDFTWTYTITGLVGQTYAFSGGATANGGAIIAPAVTSNTGQIGDFAVTVSPTLVLAGSPNVQIQFTVVNNLIGDTVNRVTVGNPSPTSIWTTDDTGTPPAWSLNDATSGSGWDATTRTFGCPGGTSKCYRFNSPGAIPDIPDNGGSETFIITFSLVGNPGADTTYTFPVAVRDTGGNTTTLNVSVTVTLPNLQVTALTVDSSVVSGGTVTVAMTVKNNGATTLSNVTPSALTFVQVSGAPNASLVSGPTPTSAPSLAPDASTSFSWTYTITGSVGESFAFSGFATANGGSVTSATVTSNTGSIASYGVSVNPTSVVAGSTAVQLQFTVTNNLTSGTLDRVTVTSTNTTIWDTNNTWDDNDTDGAWNPIAPDGANGPRYRFTAPTPGGCPPTCPDDIQPNGGLKIFTVTFFQVGDPGTDTSYSFSVAIHRRGDSWATETTLNVTVTITRYTISVTSSPSTIPADGASTSTITATLLRGGIPQSGQVVSFTTTAGILSAATATTDASGVATVTLTASASTTNVAATVTATYLPSVTAQTMVTFEGIVLSVSAVPGTIGADGQSTSTVTITLTKAGVAYSGRPVTLSTTAGTLSGASFTTNGSGQATATLTASVSETDVTATVTAGYLAPTFTATTSVTFQRVVLTVSAAPGTIGADGQSTSTITVTLTQGGAALSGATVTLATTAGTLSATTLTTNASGQATATLTASVSETDVTATVTATYKGHVKITTVTFQRVVLTISAAPTTIPANGTSTSTITVTLTQGGAALVGATVTLATTAGTLSATTLTTNASGQATATLTSTSSGTNVTATVTATYRGHVKTTTVTFGGIAITVAASPSSIPADGVATSTLTVTLTYGGIAYSGQTVTLATTAGTLSATSLTTNASGQATATLTSVSSGTNVTATVTATYLTFSNTTTVTFRGVVLSLSASPASIAADGVTTSTLTATLTAGGSGLSGKTVNFSTTAGTLSASSATTNASGQATVTLTSSVSKTNVTATITAAYLSFTNTATVTFTGITISEVGYLAATAGNGQVTLYWENPTGYFTEALVVRRAGSAPTADPVDGTTYSVGGVLGDGSEVIYKGTAVTTVNAGLTNGTTYYYKAYTAYSSSSLYSTGTLLDATPTGGGPGEPTWSYNASVPGLAEPVTDGEGGIFWGSAAGGLVGTSATDGSQLWSRALGGMQIEEFLPPTDIQGLGGFYAIVGTSSGTVAAVDVATGATLWQTAPLGDAIGGSVGMQQYWAASDATFQGQFSSDVFFVGTKNASPTNNKVYALDAATGAVLWTFNSSEATAVDVVTGIPWVNYDSNQVLITTRSNGGSQPSFWALSTLDGSVISTWSLGNIDAWLGWGMDGVVYVPAADGKLYALDLATLTMKWTSPFDTGAGNSIVGYIWEDWWLPGTLFFSTQDGNVWAIESSGSSTPPTLLWKTAVAGASAPIVFSSDGILYVGGGDGKLHQLRLADGVDEKQVTLGDGTASVGKPTWTSGSLYAGTAAGKVYAIPTPLP